MVLLFLLVDNQVIKVGRIQNELKSVIFIRFSNINATKYKVMISNIYDIMFGFHQIYLLFIFLLYNYFLNLFSLFQLRI